MLRPDGSTKFELVYFRHGGTEGTATEATVTITETSEILLDEFRALADQWHEETDDLSSPSKIAMHPAYQRIISKGERVLPLILEDLKERRGEWYWALRTISGESPVPAHAAGNRRLVDEAWLDWGRSRGYIR